MMKKQKALVRTLPIYLAFLMLYRLTVPGLPTVVVASAVILLPSGLRLLPNE
jgi:hypothetical protein